MLREPLEIDRDKLRIPEHIGHPFRLMSDSGPKSYRTAARKDIGHPFRGDIGQLFGPSVWCPIWSGTGLSRRRRE